MTPFSVSIVELPARTLAGMAVTTTLERAPVDCPALWQTFGPRIVELPPLPAGASGGFGISVMHDDRTFEYQAAVETGPGATLPEGLRAFSIPAGLYARCTVPNLGALSDAWVFLFETWLPGQSDWAYNPEAPTFEFYPPDWRQQMPFAIHMGVRKI